MKDCFCCVCLVCQPPIVVTPNDSSWRQLAPQHEDLLLPVPVCLRLLCVFSAPPRLRIIFTTLSCSYKEEARDVLEETKITATDPEKQFAISFFDNKFASLIPLKVVFVLA